ncbi:MAG: hypothetical protein ACOX6M_13760 [Armatimonadota bacterium]|jgi:hypothetical protein|nr:hypothetical protein [Acidobacteriota bacterium]
MSKTIWIAVIALVASTPELSAAWQADTPAQVAERFLVAAAQGDETGLDAAMADADWRETHPLLVRALREWPEVFASYLEEGKPALQEVIEATPDGLGVEQLARVVLRSALAAEARSLHLVWRDGGWKVGSATGLLAGLEPGGGEAPDLSNGEEASAALHTLLEGLYLISLGERHAGEAIVASVLADTVTESATQMVLGYPDAEPYVLYSYAAGTTVQEAYEDFDPFGFRVLLERIEARGDGGWRGYAVSSGARRSKPVGFVALDSGRVVIDDFSALLVGVEKPSADTW